MCVQRTSIRADLPASSGCPDSISPSSKNETYALNRSCNESSCSSEPSHSLGSFITRTASPVFESWAITSITLVRFLLLEISGSMSMTRFDIGRSMFGVQTRMTNDLSAEGVRALLKLEPHATCGFVRVTFISNQRIAPGGLAAPFLDGRPAGSALYFMVTPDAPVRLHRIRNDQLYHRYLGDPIEVLMLHENGTSERVVVV